jgi:hypothetical protein
LAALRASVLPAGSVKFPGNNAVAGLRNPALQSRGGDGSLLRGFMQGGFRGFLRPEPCRESRSGFFCKTGSGIKLSCDKQAAATFPC